MRFLRIRIAGFGPLADLDSGEAELPNMVAVLGPNEAGKSAFFAALRGILYGIYPASRDGNPWSPWDGRELALEAILRTRSGERLEVRRRLLAGPWGRLRRGGAEEDLRNRALPGAEHVPREVYEHVFAVTLPELAQLQEKAGWERVRDRLVAGLGTGDLASPREVAESLASEASALWRPVRSRGSRDARLGEELESLATRRRDARERDRSLRGHQRELEEGRRSLEALRAERTRVRAALEHARTLLPAAERLKTLEALRAEAGDPALLAGLPSDPAAELERLDRAVEAGREVLERSQSELKEAEGRIPEADPGTDGLLERRPEARALAAEAPLSAERAVRRGALGQELETLERVLDVRGGELLGIPWREVDPESLDRLPLEELRRRVRAREEVTARRLGAEEALRAEEARGAAGRAGGGRGRDGFLVAGGALLFLLGAAGVFLAGGARGELTRAVLLALLIAAAGLALAAVGAVRWLGSAGSGTDPGGAERARWRVAELLAEEERAAEGIVALVDGLPFRAERLDRPGEGLATDVERLREDLHRRGAAAGALGRLEADEEGLARRLGDLREAVPGLELPPDPARALPLLQRLLDDADEWAKERERALEARDRAAGSVRLAEAAYERVSAELEAFGTLLGERARGLPPPDAAESLRRRLEARDEADRLARDLRREHGELDRLRERVREAAEDPMLAEHSPAELGERDRELEERIEALGGRVEGLQRDLHHLSARETSDLVEAEIERVREERERIRRERDRLWALARVVEVAERRFRDAHQPDLVRTAGEHLRRITGGRYAGLILGDDGDPDRLLVTGSHLPGRHPVEEPLSTGTREQIYLSLRLAMLELLEGDGEPLPLILDEALVNWDRERRALGLDLIGDVAAGRQVFLFTCHPDLAREAEARGARCLALATPGMPSPAR